MEAVGFQAAGPPVPAAPVRVQSPWQEAKFSGNLLLLALVIGAALELCGPSWIRAALKTVTLYDINGVAVLLGALLTAVIFHEAGHLIASLLMDFKLVAVSFGPLKFGLSDTGWTMRFSGSFAHASISAVSPRADSSRKRKLFVVASGPFATLITGIVSALAFVHAPLQALPHTFLAELTVLSFLLFLLGLVPNPPDSRVKNDARMFWSLLRSCPSLAAVPVAQPDFDPRS